MGLVPLSITKKAGKASANINKGKAGELGSMK